MPESTEQGEASKTAKLRKSKRRKEEDEEKQKTMKPFPRSFSPESRQSGRLDEQERLYEPFEAKEAKLATLSPR
jgi:hypothetical protein